MSKLIHRISLLLFSAAVLAAAMCSCGSRSLEDFREEGEGTTRSLISMLQLIHNRDDLVQSIPKLRRLFNKLVDVMIDAREFQLSHPDAEVPEMSRKNYFLSDQLRNELNRIYNTIESGREMIAKCQDEALNRLDSFESGKKKSVVKK